MTGLKYWPLIFENFSADDLHGMCRLSDDAPRRFSYSITFRNLIHVDWKIFKTVCLKGPPAIESS